MDLIFGFQKADIWLKIRDLFYLQATIRRRCSQVESEASLSPEEVEVAGYAIDDWEGAKQEKYNFYTEGLPYLCLIEQRRKYML